MIHTHQSVLEISSNYKGIILDIWGVLHSSGVPFKNVLQNLETLKKQGKYVILVSNAPRRSSSVQAFLQNTIKVEKGKHFDDIMTSGELFFLQNQHKNSNIFYIGPEKDLNILENSNLNIVKDLSQKPKFAVITGYAQNVEETFNIMLKNNIPLYCLNPDIFITKQDGSREECAGFLAEKYKQLKGEVIYFGKPFTEIYSKVLELFSIQGIQKNDILAVGDGMETDILGANNANIKNALCLSGLPSYELTQGVTLFDYINKFDSKPNFIIQSL